MDLNVRRVSRVSFSGIAPTHIQNSNIKINNMNINKSNSKIKK